MRTLKRLLLAVLLAIPVTMAAVYLFKTLDARDGLTSSQINCIMKDSRGYVWFGTPAGLYRYDGYTFKSFQCNSQDGSSLPDSYIESIQESLDGNLWMKTASGYTIYHPQTETFERDMRQTFNRMGIERQPDLVYIDRHKNLWGYIPNKGIVCYNMQQQLLYEFGYTDDAHGVPQGEVCSIGECRDGAIIVYVDGRIVCCDVMHQQRTVWSTTELADRHLRKTKSLRVFADQMDNIWVYGQGTLFLYNKSTNTWNTSVGDQLGLTGTSVDNGVNGMAGDHNGNIWIGTDRNGLVRTSVTSHDMEFIEPTSMRSRKRQSGIIGIQSVYVDDTDMLWVGTEKSGVALWGQNIYKFEAELNGDITAIAEDKNGTIWYGTSDNGIVGYSGPLASLKVTCIASTKDGSIWVGSKQNGLTRIKDGASKIFSQARDSVKTLIDDHINALCADNNGNLWIATDGGLQVYNTKMNSFSAYTRQNRKLMSNNITSLHLASGNRILVGTGEGLSIVTLSTSEVTHLTGNTSNVKKFTNNYVTQVFEDSRGLLWIGTREGVNVLNLTNDNLDYLTEKNGLCNNNICGITEDKNNNIWLTTSNGVSRVVVQRNHEDDTFSYGLYNYNTTDGLQSNEFNPGSILRKKDGNVLLGGLYGVNWVRPKTADETESLPRVMLTQLFIGEEEILTGHDYDGRLILPQALNESNKLELGHNQNTITIKFAAGNYNQSERLQFMYWMEGLDDDWTNGDALTHGVTFRNLSSGHYTLHVKAVSAEGAVSNQERTLDITIERHWLLSWWMLIAYAAAIIIILYIWKIGIDQLKEYQRRKKAIISQLKQQSETIMAASDDLRQPMVRMTTIIGNLAGKDATPEEREQLNSLHSLMLQVITRVSDMQTSLEHPEEKAKDSVQSRYMLDSKGELQLPDLEGEQLTTEIRVRQNDAPTKQFSVIFIDDNMDFIKYIAARLRYVYDLHVFNNTTKAMRDIETLHPDLIICKNDMQGMSGSEMCNTIKMNHQLQRIKFVIMTEGQMTTQDMKDQNVTLSADDYLAKPFNLQEAIMRFNRLLGVGLVEIDTNLIEGAETRRLEGRNASMTTATETMDMGTFNPMDETVADEDDEMNSLGIKVNRSNTPMRMSQQGYGQQDDETEDYLSEYSMADAMDQQLLKNIEQYVVQNMSRGQISLEEMATAMGMGRVPFFHKIRNITGKTPAELVRDLRLKHACILLKRTNINMSELASNVGFMTGENFINIFKEKFGISPLEYRLKHRQ